MDVFISVDIEGINGVMSGIHQDPDGVDYRRACDWMVQEVNAVIDGAVKAGAKRVVVKDSHNTATNIDLGKLHPVAELISGWGPVGSMVEGVDESFDAVFLIGYHARAATVGGTLAHTWSSHVLELALDSQIMGESGWAATFAGHFNVPVVLVTGDDKLVEQVREELPAGVHTVRTKTGMAINAARMRPLHQLHNELRETAAHALSQAASIPPLKPPFPAMLSIRFRQWEHLDRCEAVPHVVRVDAQTFQVQVADAIEAHKYFATLYRLART